MTFLLTVEGPLHGWDAFNHRNWYSESEPADAQEGDIWQRAGRLLVRHEERWVEVQA